MLKSLFNKTMARIYPKTLTKTLGKISNFVKEIESGIEQNTAKSQDIQVQKDILAEEQRVLSVEISVGKQFLSKLR